MTKNQTVREYQVAGRAVVEVPGTEVILGENEDPAGEATSQREKRVEEYLRAESIDPDELDIEIETEIVDSSVEYAPGTELVEVTFQPQAWSDDYAVNVDGKTSFVVPLADAIDEGGNLYPDNSGQSDQLRLHPNAPKDVREWSGPFYMRLERIGAAGNGGDA